MKINFWIVLFKNYDDHRWLEVITGSSYLAGEVFFAALFDPGRWRTQQIPNTTFDGESVAWHVAFQPSGTSCVSTEELKTATGSWSHDPPPTAQTGSAALLSLDSVGAAGTCGHLVSSSVSTSSALTACCSPHSTNARVCLTSITQSCKTSTRAGLVIASMIAFVCRWAKMI